MKRGMRQRYFAKSSKEILVVLVFLFGSSQLAIAQTASPNSKAAPRPKKSAQKVDESEVAYSEFNSVKRSMLGILDKPSSRVVGKYKSDQFTGACRNPEIAKGLQLLRTEINAFDQSRKIDDAREALRTQRRPDLANHSALFNSENYQSASAFEVSFSSSRPIEPQLREAVEKIKEKESKLLLAFIERNDQINSLPALRTKGWENQLQVEYLTAKVSLLENTQGLFQRWSDHLENYCRSIEDQQNFEQAKKHLEQLGKFIRLASDSLVSISETATTKALLGNATQVKSATGVLREHMPLVRQMSDSTYVAGRLSKSLEPVTDRLDHPRTTQFETSGNLIKLKASPSVTLIAK